LITSSTRSNTERQDDRRAARLEILPMFGYAKPNQRD